MKGKAMAISWLPKSYIADLTRSIVERFRLTPPIMADELIELEFGLTLSIEDLDAKYDESDVLGELSVATKTITINAKLVDDQSREGRLNFTAAHELGHWLLHRNHIETLNRRAGGADIILCRTMNQSQRIEWQAN